LLWYSGLTLNQDKARQRRTGLKLIHYISMFPLFKLSQGNALLFQANTPKLPYPRPLTSIKQNYLLQKMPTLLYPRK